METGVFSANQKFERTLPELRLREPTHASWTAAVMANFDLFLVDHAACERKAAAQCLSLAYRYLREPILVEPLVSLAREELEHFQQVYRLIVKRRVEFLPDERDPYVNALLDSVKKVREVKRLDRLLIVALIESRSAERFLLLAQSLTDPELKAFYQDLARTEAGHHKVFLRIASRLEGCEETARALDLWLDVEADVVRRSEIRPAVH